MTDTPPVDHDIGNEQAFTHSLNRLLRIAYENGVDVEGGWECRNGPSYPDWEAVIVTMSKPGKDTAESVD